MSMSKKDFIALADVIRANDPRRMPEAWVKLARESAPQTFEGYVCQWESTRDALADFCAAQNPRFNRERWLGYIAGECGPNGGRVKK